MPRCFWKGRTMWKCVVFFLIRKLISCLARWAWHSWARVCVKVWFPLLFIAIFTALRTPSIQWMFVKTTHGECPAIQCNICQCNSQSIAEPRNSPFTNWCPTLGRQSRPKLNPGLSINSKHLSFVPLAS